jgi:hypothetical protein
MGNIRIPGHSDEPGYPKSSSLTPNFTGLRIPPLSDGTPVSVGKYLHTYIHIFRNILINYYL